MDDVDGPDLERLSAERLASRARDSALVAQVRAGDAQAFGKLYDAWFDRIFDLTSRILRNADVAAEVSQDAFLSAWRNLHTLENPDAFGGWLLRIARNAAYNRSEREQRSRAVDDQELAMIESVGAGAGNAPAGFAVEDRLGRAATPGAALEDAEIVSLVWQAAEALPDRDAEVLDLQLRHGLTPAEIGEMLGLNRNAANQLVHRVRGRLETAIRARVLWRSGEPVCDVLNQRLNQAAITSFGPEAVRVIERHVPGCVECDERQRLRLQPAALFAAVPIMVAPLVVKQSVAAVLVAAGVPMAGSVAATGAAIAGGVAGSAGSVGSVGHVGAQVGGQLGQLGQAGHAAHLGVAGQVGSVGHVGHVGNVGPLGPLGAPNVAGGPISGAGHIGSQVGSSAGFPGSGIAGQVPGAAAPPPPPGGFDGGADGLGGGGDAGGGGGGGAGGGGAGGGGAGGGDVHGAPQPIVLASRRNPWLLASGVAASLLFLLLLFAGGLWWGNRDTSSSVVAVGATSPPTSSPIGSLPQTTTFTVPGSTLSPGTAPPGTEPDTTTSSSSTSSSSSAPSSTQPATTRTTEAPTTTDSPTTSSLPTTTASTSTTSTSSTTSTTTGTLRTSIAINPNTVMADSFGNYAMQATTTPVLTWSVAGNLGSRTVRVVGRENGSDTGFTSTAASGKHELCPESYVPTGAGGPRCTKVSAGTFTYRLEILDGNGTVIPSETKTASFTITFPVIP